MLSVKRKRHSRKAPSRRAIVAVAAAGTAFGATYLARRRRHHGGDELRLTEDFEPLPATSEEAFLTGHASPSRVQLDIEDGPPAPSQHAIGEAFAGYPPP